MINFLINQWCFLVRAAEDEVWCLKVPKVQRSKQKRVSTYPQLFFCPTSLHCWRFNSLAINSIFISNCRHLNVPSIAWKYLTSESAVRQKWTDNPPCENIADLRGRTLSWCAHRSGHIPSSLRRHHLHLVQCKHWLGPLGPNLNR